MKRNIVLLLCLAMAVALCVPLAAQAASLGDHDDASGNPCKRCHDTAEGVASLRGWTRAQALGDPGTSWGKNVSILCYYCHDGVGTLGANNMIANAYSDSSHGYDYDLTLPTFLPYTPDGDLDSDPVTTSGMPYTDVTNLELECTSCHNVHVSDVYPFNQRGTIETLCDTCHPGRINSTPDRGAANSAAGYIARGVVTGYSTHPTTIAVADVAGSVDVVAPGVIGRNDLLNYDFTTATAAGKLGGHLDNLTDGTSGNMTCQTCHAVHGPSQGNGGNNDLLAYDNTTNAGANGSVLCEACHEGGRDGTFNMVGLSNAGNGTTTFGDHPIDALANRPFYPTGVEIPDGAPVAANWTAVGNANNDRGAQPFYAAAGSPVCSSCHDTHGGIDATALLRGASVTAANAITWTFDYDEWCFVCHLASQVVPDNHHSNVNNMSSTVDYGGGVDEYDSLLACGDCHGPLGTTQWTAHNGFWQWVAGSEPAVGNSDFCEACHTPTNPTVLSGSALKGQNLAGADLPSTHGTIRGTASHQVNSAVDGTNPNMDITPDWTFASGGTSEWGLGANTPICESCHNILVNGFSAAAGQGVKQGWKGNILLAPYEDDDSGTITGVEDGPTTTSHDWYTGDDTTVPPSWTFVQAGSAGNTGVSFCRACHVSLASEFVHNPEAHTMELQTATPYTYAADTEPYGRSTNTVMTTPSDSLGTDCPEVSTADQQSPAAAPNGLSYPAADAVDCDSCHVPHHADDQSVDGTRYLILEITDTAYGTTICAECHDPFVQCN